MSARSKIEWTDRTWNPVRGCSRVSEGCRNCYAERQAARFQWSGEPFHGFVADGKWTGRVELVESKLDEPLRWRKPSRVFVNSMSDLFHESLPDEAIDRVFAVMALAPRHTFQVLTKRPKRMLEYLNANDGLTTPLRVEEALHAMQGKRDGERWVSTLAARWPLPNVWLGVSVEDQQTADERIPALLETPAAVRFVSYEPALGPVDFGSIRFDRHAHFNVLEGCGTDARSPAQSTTNATCNALDWIIVGGESGPGARPFNVQWAYDTLRQCRAANTPCFIKQLGANCGYSPECADALWFQGRRSTSADECGYHGVRRLKDAKGGDPSEWPADLRVREFPRSTP